MLKIHIRTIFPILIISSILAFTGCSQENLSEINETDKYGVAETNGKMLEISWVSASYTPIDDNAILKLKIERDFNVKINVVFIDHNAYTDVMKLKFASGDVPDYFFSPNYDLYARWAREGLLEEITEEEIRKYGPVIAKGIDEVVEKHNKYLWTIGIVDGKRYSFPSVWMSGVYHAPIVWRYDWLENLEIDKVPETLEEAETALYKFAKEDPDRNGRPDTYGLSSEGMKAFWGMSGYYPGGWIEEEGKLVHGNIQMENRDIVAMFAKWYRDGVLDPEFITGENQGGYWAVSHDFINSKIGLTCMGYYYHWAEKTGSNIIALKQTNPNARISFGKPIKGLSGNSGMRVSGVYSHAYNVFRKGIEKEKIYKVLEIVSGINKDKDTILSYAYGEQGEHWDYNDDELIEMKPEWRNKELELGSGQTFYMWNNPKREEWTGIPRVVKWAQENFMYPGYTNIIYVTLPSDEKKAEADKLYNDVLIEVITGNASLEDWDIMIKQIRESCYDQLTKEANEWYRAINKND